MTAGQAAQTAAELVPRDDGPRVQRSLRIRRGTWARMAARANREGRPVNDVMAALAAAYADGLIDLPSTTTTQASTTGGSR